MISRVLKMTPIVAEVNRDGRSYVNLRYYLRVSNLMYILINLGRIQRLSIKINLRKGNSRKKRPFKLAHLKKDLKNPFMLSDLKVYLDVFQDSKFKIAQKRSLSEEAFIKKGYLK